MKIHRYRSILAQTIAISIKNFLLLDLGISMAFPVILIPALTGLSRAVNPHEVIRIRGSEASWLGSIIYIMTVFGSIVSGIITEPLGRKKAMLIVNIPHLLGWLLLYFSTTHTQVFIGMALLGLGVGLMEAPIITYVGEVSEASIRNVMIAMSGISASGGFLLVIFLGSWLPWRTVALICSSVPIAALFSLCFIPETPIWLLSKDRDEEATKSLQWLRGWVTKTEIEKELNELIVYRDYTRSCSDCQKSKIKCVHGPFSLADRIRKLFEASYVKPMLIITITSMFSGFTGAHHLNPYLEQILNTFETPIEPSNATILFGVTTLAGTIYCTIVVKFMSKRLVYMMSMVVVVICNLWLGIYGLKYLPEDAKSFRNSRRLHSGENASYIPISLIIVMRFATNALISVPTMYESELFPLQSRSIAAGVSVGISCTYLFIAIKTFYNIEYWLNMSSTFCIYGVIGIIGLFVSYMILPATEGRSLEEIEKHYSDSRKKLTDRNILPNIGDPIKS